MQELAIEWIRVYGYIGIFSLLVLGIVGMPIPDEWLITFSGYLVFKHTLQFTPAVASTFLGAACGISVSYAAGRSFGVYLIEKYDHVIHVTNERLKAAGAWFDRLGRWTLFVGYFIPGVRHLTAYLAGTSAVAMAFMFWSISFFLVGNSIRTVTVPVECSNVPVNMELSRLSTDTVQVQLRGSAWILDSVSLNTLVVRFDLTGSREGPHVLDVEQSTLNLPPGLIIANVSARKVSLNLVRSEQP